MSGLWERFRDEVLRIWEPADLLMQEGGSTDTSFRQILYNHKPVPAVVPDRETPKFAIESIWRIGQLIHVAVRMRVTEWVELGRDPIDAKQTIKLFFAQLDGLPNPNLYKDYLCDEEAGLLVSAAGDSEKAAEWKRLISHRRHLTGAIVVAQYKLMLLRRELKEQLADPPAETELAPATIPVEDVKPDPPKSVEAPYLGLTFNSIARTVKREGFAKVVELSKGAMEIAFPAMLNARERGVTLSEIKRLTPAENVNSYRQVRGRISKALKPIGVMVEHAKWKLIEVDTVKHSPADTVKTTKKPGKPSRKTVKKI